MLEINKSELKTNETLTTQVTNASFYKADKNRPQLGLHKSPYAGNYSFTKHKTKVTLKIV